LIVRSHLRPVALGVAGVVLVGVALLVGRKLQHEREDDRKNTEKAEKVLVDLRKTGAVQLSFKMNTAPQKLTSNNSAPPPSAGPDLRLVTGEMKSSRAGLYAMTVAISVTRRTQPFGVVVECDRDVENAEFVIDGQSEYQSVLQGSIKGDPRSYYIGFASPAVTPDAPLFVTLFGKAPFHITRVSEVDAP